jgi:UDP-N-acetylmuramyl tripeptide synthase
MRKYINLIKKFIPGFVISTYHLVLSFIGALYCGFPGKKIKVIGITGTNGKSTVVGMTSQILKEAGYKVASSSSIVFKIGEMEEENKMKMTMPGGLILQKFLKKAVSEKCDYAIIEVTSEGIKQHRHRFINFDVVAGNFLFLSIFTFKTPDASVSNSNHDPRLGIILAAKHLFPFVMFNGKNTPGERVN